MTTSENEVTVASLRTGDTFITPDDEVARVSSPLGHGDGELARLSIVAPSNPFVQYVDWSTDTRVQVLTRAEQPNPPDIEALRG